MPSEFAWAVVSMPVSTFLIVTVVFGVAAPAASVTLPVTVANVVCACAASPSNSANTKMRNLALKFIDVLTHLKIHRVFLKSRTYRKSGDPAQEKVSGYLQQPYLNVV